MPGSDWDNYESGPFCKHWSQLHDCEEICAKCKKTCREHTNGEVECDFYEEYTDSLVIMEDSIKEKP